MELNVLLDYVRNGGSYGIILVLLFYFKNNYVLKEEFKKIENLVFKHEKYNNQIQISLKELTVKLNNIDESVKNLNKKIDDFIKDFTKRGINSYFE